MPFRTRDFLVFLLTVAFLIVGIASTIHSDLSLKSTPQLAAALESTSGEEVTYVAELPPESDMRGSRLKELRQKIAELIIPEAEEIAVVEEEPAPSEEEPVVSAGEVLLCSTYAPVSPSWSASGVAFEIMEGARLVYRPLVPTVTINELGEEVSTPTKEVLLQLPLRTFPQTTKTCIPADVIGIALDGSLIRNSEQGLYQIFEGDTRIGYALDGFPIHGTAGAGITVDACGGATVGGEYRYFLSKERLGILGCYSGSPVSI